MADELLGGGLDIDGWNYLKLEQNRSVHDLIDKSHIHRQMTPLVLRNTLPKEHRQEANEAIVACLEAKSTFMPEWVAEKIKTTMDSLFSPSWHVVIGEDFTFNIDYENKYLYYFLYGSHAILAWKCGSIMSGEVNHLSDPNTKEKLKSILMVEKGMTATSLKDYFSEKI